MTYFDEIIQRGKTDPIGAAVEMTLGLMRGDKESLKLGYSLGSALISAAEQFLLTADSVAVVAEKVVDQTEEHYSATRRPLVVAIMDGGLIQSDITAPGLGTPELVTLDYDREDDTPEGITEFLDYVEEVRAMLKDRGIDLADHDYGFTERDRGWIEPNPDWPVDHAEGE